MEKIKLTAKNYKEVLETAVKVLKAGGLVIYPTETCYGIGTDPTNLEAVTNLLDYKSKRENKPVSIAVNNIKMANKYVYLNKTAKTVYKNFLPGPVTVISKSRHKVVPKIESVQQTLGIRIPKYKLVQDIVKNFGKPITSTSANASYKKTPYTIKDILDNISEKQKKLITLIIDAGKLPKREPSTIIDTTLDNIYIVREGHLKFDSPNIYYSYSLEDTKKFVDVIFKKIEKYITKKKIIIELEGDLGAGKTHFTRFLAEHLNIKNNISSPTFIICREHDGSYKRKKIKLFHMDTYRLYNANEIDELEPERIFGDNSIVVIEWANKVSTYIKKYIKKSINIKIKINSSVNDKREFKYEIKNISN